MSFVDIVSPYIPELIGVIFFLVGYLTLSYLNKPTDLNSFGSDLPSLIQNAILSGHTEKAISYLEQYSLTEEVPDIKLFNTVLRSCSDLKNCERAVQIFDTMKSNVKMPRPTLETYEILAKSFIDARKPSKVFELLGEIDQTQLMLSEVLQTMAIESYVKHSCIVEATSLFEKSDFKPTLLPILIKSLTKNHFNDKALTLYRANKHYLKDSEVVVSLFEHSVKSDYLVLIAEIFSDLKHPNTNSFNLMIKSYTRCNQIEDCINLLRVMVSKSMFPEEAIISGLIETCGRSGKFAAAETAYSMAKKSGSSLLTFNTMIEACVRCQNMTSAWKVLDEMKAVQCAPDNFTYSSLIRGIKSEGENGDLERAFGLLAALKTSNMMVPDEVLYNCLLDACVSAKKIERAVELFKEMPKHDEISFNTIIKGYSQSKQINKAVEMLEFMKKSGIKPNEVTYNSIIDTCVRCNQCLTAWKYLDEMESIGLVPDNFTYSTLVKGIKGDQCSEELERTFAILEKGQISPDEVLYNCLIDACVRVGDLKKSVEIFKKMQQSGIEASSVTYGIMIKAYGQGNMLKKALETFKEMKSKNLKANDVTYGCLIDACVRAGEIEMAQDIFGSMQAEGIVLNTILYTTMIKGYAKTQNLTKALDLLQDMKKNVQPNNVTYNSLLDCAVRCEDMVTAKTLFVEMNELMQPDLITYSTMIKGFCKAGEVESALEVLTNMQHKGISPDEVLFNSLLDGCAKLGNLETAEKVYSEMKALNIKPSNVTYSILIKLYGKNRQINRALEVLEDMKASKVAPGMIVYTCLLQACIRCKQIHKAIQLYADMNKNGVRGDKVTFNTLVNGCVYAKQLDTAFKIAVDSFALNVRLADDVYNNLLRNLIGTKNQQRIQWADEIREKMNNKGFDYDSSIFKATSQFATENFSEMSYKKKFQKKTPMAERKFNVSN